MTYKETLAYLFDKLPMYQRIGEKAFKKSLDNITNLLSALGNPQSNFKSIHIAGTNGKGTVAHLLSAVLQENGLKVGLYTSPHYRDFRERIKINGDLIHKNSIIGFVKKYQKLIEEIKPSFFEVTVAMAFHKFAEAKVDIAVVETGLGGRLDSTNVLMPIISIITNISLDHQEQLGNTLQEIAGEKAGIIKYSVPTVIGEYQEAVISVFEKAALSANSPLHLASEESRLSQEGSSYNFYVDDTLICQDIRPPQTNAVFLKNLRTALYALWVIRQRLDLDFSTCAKAVAQFSTLSNYIGRFQKISSSPDIILDSAHNSAGLMHLFEDLKVEQYNRLHLVVGFVQDKDVKEALKLFPQDAQYYWCKADIPRGMDVETLATYGSEAGLQGKTYRSVHEALTAAKKEAASQDLVLVCGSIFVVAEVV